MSVLSIPRSAINMHIPLTADSTSCGATLGVFTTREKSRHFLDILKLSYFRLVQGQSLIPHKTASDTAFVWNSPKNIPCYFCLCIQLPHGAILMQGKLFHHCLVQHQSCCAIYSFWDITQIQQLLPFPPNPVVPKQTDTMEKQCLGRVSDQPVVQRTF